MLPEGLGPFELQLQGHLVHLVFLLFFGGDDFSFMVTLLGLQLPLMDRQRHSFISTFSVMNPKKQTLTDKLEWTLTLVFSHRNATGLNTCYVAFAKTF